MISATLDFKRLICRVLIGVFVFAQIAVAAYACPQLSSVVADEARNVATAEAASAAMDAHGSTDCLATQGDHGYAGMDPGSPHLCLAHCQYGNQSADHTPAPVVPPALLTAMYTLAPAEEAVASRIPRASLIRGGPPGASGPPHAILHCCLRD